MIQLEPNFPGVPSFRLFRSPAVLIPLDSLAYTTLGNCA